MPKPDLQPKLNLNLTPLKLRGQPRNVLTTSQFWFLMETGSLKDNKTCARTHTHTHTHTHKQSSVYASLLATSVSLRGCSPIATWILNLYLHFAEQEQDFYCLTVV